MDSNKYFNSNGIVLGCTNTLNCCEGESPDCTPCELIKNNKNNKI